jgi:hypothetical protein
MAVLGWGCFLMSEVPLYPQAAMLSSCTANSLTLALEGCPCGNITVGDVSVNAQNHTADYSGIS